MRLSLFAALAAVALLCAEPVFAMGIPAGATMSNGGNSYVQPTAVVDASGNQTCITGNPCAVTIAQGSPSSPTYVAQPDVPTAPTTINSATPNAAVTVILGNAYGRTDWAVSGLTASGATLTLEGEVCSNTTPCAWTALVEVPVTGSSPIATLTADTGILRTDSGGLYAERLRVSSTGSGNISIAATASAVSGGARLAAGSNHAGSVSLDPSAGANIGNVGPAPRTIVPLDISTVTTGGTAVTALNAGHRTAGGFLFNPIGATINLCINEQGTASGTTSAGALTCIQPGQSYTLTPSSAAVSVITSDSSHPFSGQGLN